jgi:hypothetical protein
MKLKGYHAQADNTPATLAFGRSNNIIRLPIRVPMREQSFHAFLAPLVEKWVISTAPVVEVKPDAL